MSFPPPTPLTTLMIASTLQITACVKAVGPVSAHTTETTEIAFDYWCVCYDSSNARMLLCAGRGDNLAGTSWEGKSRPCFHFTRIRAQTIDCMCLMLPMPGMDF